MKKVPDTKHVRKSVSLPEIVAEMAKKRAKEQGYPDFSSYIYGLIIFDCYCNKDHWLTSRLAREPREIQELVILEVMNNPGKSSTWIDHMIEKKARELRLGEIQDGD